MWRYQAIAVLLHFVTLLAGTQGEVYPPRLSFYVQVRGNGRKQRSTSPLLATKEPTVSTPIGIKVASKPLTERQINDPLSSLVKRLPENPLSSLAKRLPAKPAFLSRSPSLPSAVEQAGTKLRQSLSKTTDGEEDDSHLLGWYILCFSCGLMFDTLF